MLRCLFVAVPFISSCREIGFAFKLLLRLEKGGIHAKLDWILKTRQMKEAFFFSCFKALVEEGREPIKTPLPQLRPEVLTWVLTQMRPELLLHTIYTIIQSLLFRNSALGAKFFAKLYWDIKLSANLHPTQETG